MLRTIWVSRTFQFDALMCGFCCVSLKSLVWWSYFKGINYVIWGEIRRKYISRCGVRFTRVCSRSRSCGFELVANVSKRIMETFAKIRESSSNSFGISGKTVWCDFSIYPYKADNSVIIYSCTYWLIRYFCRWFMWLTRIHLQWLKARLLYVIHQTHFNLYDSRYCSLLLIVNETHA